MRGYMGEIGWPQARHFPLNHSQPSTGTLSYHLMSVSQRGHREPGNTMDNSSGIRMMQTFRKLPMTSPNRKANTTTKLCSIAARLYAQSATVIRLSQSCAAPECLIPNSPFFPQRSFSKFVPSGFGFGCDRRLTVNGQLVAMHWLARPVHRREQP